MIPICVFAGILIVGGIWLAIDEWLWRRRVRAVFKPQLDAGTRRLREALQWPRA